MTDERELLASADTVAAVRRLEDYIEANGIPEVPLAADLVVHGRMAARTILIPAGTLLTGVQTNCDNVCIVCGDISVTAEGETVRLTGYHVLPARAGFKRAGWAHADTWWTTVHHTLHTDPVEIEREMSDEAHRLQTRRALDQQAVGRIEPCRG